MTLTAFLGSKAVTTRTVSADLQASRLTGAAVIHRRALVASGSPSFLTAKQRIIGLC